MTGDEAVAEYLEHYGVKGMQWRHRKDKKKIVIQKPSRKNFDKNVRAIRGQKEPKSLIEQGAEKVDGILKGIGRFSMKALKGLGDLGDTTTRDRSNPPIVGGKGTKVIKVKR